MPTLSSSPPPPTTTPQTNYFNTRSIESGIQDVMAIKSTVPVGYTAKTRALFKCDNLIFSPKSCAKAVPCMTTCTPAALWWVSRSERAQTFAKLLSQGAVKQNIEVLFTDSTEAEAVGWAATTSLRKGASSANQSYLENSK